MKLEFQKINKNVELKCSKCGEGISKEDYFVALEGKEGTKYFKDNCAKQEFYSEVLEIWEEQEQFYDNYYESGDNYFDSEGIFYESEEEVFNENYGFWNYIKENEIEIF